MMTVKTILFVENDPVALTMYQNRLQREGFHLETAEDGLTAVKVLSQLTPDLVVLDLILPKLSGAEILRFMRSNPRLKNVPVIVFSNAPLTEMAEEIENAGNVRRLLKTDCTFPMLLQNIIDLLPAPGTNAALASAPAASSWNHPPAGPMKIAEPDPSEPPAQSAAGPQSRDDFLREALAEIPRIREHCFAYIKAPGSPVSSQHLPNLYQRIHRLNSNAGQVGSIRIATLTGAFEALLAEIMGKPSWVTPSMLQTIAQAVDCLGGLLRNEEVAFAESIIRAKVLAVDDDAVCNHVLVNTLKRSNFDAHSIEDPLAALQQLQNNSYDIILLDINMPDLTGFELCEKLRRLPHCKTTPVIFITAHNNFDNRKQSVLSGGHDFITKPVSPLELALKVTVHLLKNQMHRPSATAPEPESSETSTAPAASQQPTTAAAAATESRTGRAEPAEPPAKTVVIAAQPNTSTAPVPSTAPAPAAEPVPAFTQTAAERAAPVVAAPEPQLEPVMAATAAPGLETAAALSLSSEPQAETARSPAVEAAPPKALLPDPSTGTVDISAPSPISQIRVSHLEILNPFAAVPTRTELASAPISTLEAETAPPTAATPTEEVQLKPEPAPTTPATAPAPYETATETGTGGRESAIEPAPSTEEPKAPAISSDNSIADSAADILAELAVPAASPLPAESPEPEAKVSAAPEPGPAPVPTGANEEIQTNVTASANQPAETSPASLMPAPPQPAATPSISPQAIAAPAPVLTPEPAAARPADAASAAPATQTEVKPLESKSSEDAAESELLLAAGPDEQAVPTSPVPEPEPQPAIPAAAGLKPAAAALPADVQNEIFEQIVMEVTRLIFGENNVTELNARLVRLSLERRGIKEMLRHPAST